MYTVNPSERRPFHAMRVTLWCQPQVKPCVTLLGSVHWQAMPGLPLGLPTGPKRP